MKSLIKILKEELLNNKSTILERRSELESDGAWLTYLYCGNWLYPTGTYIQSVYDPQQNYALYGVRTSEVNEWKEKLKQNKGISRFRVVRANDKSYSIICFKYDSSKDIERQNAIEADKADELRKAQEFENEVKNADTSKYSVTQHDIDKMTGYFNKRSNPERLVKSIKDSNKLVARWIAAMILNWPEAVSEFNDAILNRGILTKAELLAYSEKYKDQRIESGLNRLSDLDKKLLNSWITSSLYKWLETLPFEIEWLESFKGAKTVAGQDEMSRNGRAWTEGFIIRVTKGESSKDFTFDIVTNEGGGLYGYVLNGYYDVVNLKTFKEQLLKEFEKI